MVQGPGMAQWVRADMVRRLGAWGGIDTPFLREFLLGLPERAGLCQPTQRGRQPLRELGYRIAALALSSGARMPAGLAGDIEPFLAMCRDAGRTLQPDAVLARSHALAEAFDRYEMDRPDLIEAWRAGRAWRDASDRWTDEATATEAWQRALWRATVPGQWAPHEAWCALRELIRRLDVGEVPGRLADLGLISVFGVSSIPALALHALRALGSHLPVHLHMLVPTLAFQSRGHGRRAEVARARAQGTDTLSLRSGEGVEEHHPLLGSLGGAAAAAAAVVESIDAEFVDLEPETADASMLASMQRALCLDLPPATVPHEADASVHFHGVASPTRMAEVVHDEVLRGFRDLPNLRQEEVLVLAPQLESLAGTLQGVARERAPLHGDGAAPVFRVADAAGADRAQVAVAILRLFDLASEDQPFDRVRALLQSPVCCARADLEAARMESLLDALEEAGARRFVDASARANWLGASHPDDALHTLEWSIDRVMLGVAAGDSPAARVVAGGVLPSGSMPALESAEVHRAIGLIEAIADLSRMRARGAHPIPAWHAAISSACDAILPPADHETFGRQRMQAERALSEVSQAAAAAGLQALPWPVARAEFEAQLQGLVEGRSFAVGGITLARLTPMRSVPARLLILAGIDHGAFPRPSRRDALDLSRLCPRVGDRDDRLEDQLLLLESIHAATERLVIVVQDTVAASGQPGPLSPVIDELMASVAAHAGMGPGGERARLLDHHPTLGDQPEAWTLDRAPGFDRRARARASMIETARCSGADRVFATSPHGEASLALSAIDSVDRMASVLRNPSRAWLQGQGVRVADLGAELGEGCEPIELDSLEKWTLNRRVREGVLLREDPESILRELQFGGHLPHGVAGNRAWSDIWREQSSILPVLSEALQLPASDLSLERIEFEVAGFAPGLRAATLWCPSRKKQVLVTKKKREKEWLALWPEHLAFAVARPESTCLRVELPATRTGAVSLVLHDPVDPGIALGFLRILHEITEQAQRRLLPVHAEILHPFRTPDTTDLEERLDAARARLEARRTGVPSLDAEPWFRMAWRGLDFMRFGREPGAPRVAGLEPSFAGIGSWLHEAMEATGWTARSRGRGT